MPQRSRPPIGPLIAVCLFTLLLCLGVIFVYVGWEPFAGKPGFSLSETGYAAMAIGLIATLMLGVGLVTLILSGRRKD